jgi:hypothetical protein
VSQDGATERELVLVPLSSVREVDECLRELLNYVDSTARLRPELLRIQRIVREMDPDKTNPGGIASSSAPNSAYSASSKFDSGLWGPRFAKEDK